MLVQCSKDSVFTLDLVSCFAQQLPCWLLAQDEANSSGSRWQSGSDTKETAERSVQSVCQEICRV